MLQTENRRPPGSRRDDYFDFLLKWVHHLLNPPAPAPARARSGRTKRERDRVPI